MHSEAPISFPETITQPNRLREDTQFALGEIITSRIFGANNDQSIILDQALRYIAGNNGPICFSSRSPLPLTPLLHSPIESLFNGTTATYSPEKSLGFTSKYRKDEPKNTEPSQLGFSKLSPIQHINLALSSINPKILSNLNQKP